MQIYFDNAATTFPKPESVSDAVNDCMRGFAVNAGRGIYDTAQQADKIIAETRFKISALLGLDNGHVIFTPSATLALNQILLGFTWKTGDNIYTTSLEHNSVVRVLAYIEKEYRVNIIHIPLCKKSLTYDLVKLEKMMFNHPPQAVVVTHVSNVCGLITPIDEILIIAKQYKTDTNSVPIIVDGAQGGPLLSFANGAQVDYYVFSGHKTFYGPFGIAGFWTNGKYEEVHQPVLFGGTGSHSEDIYMPEELPFKYEVGSPNIVAIAGLHAACNWLEAIGGSAILEHEQYLLKRLVEGLSEFDEIKINISTDLSRHTSILSFNIDNYTSQEVAMVLSQEYGIAVRAGLHCAPWAHQFLETFPRGTVRIGIGYFNTIEDIDCLIRAVGEFVDE